MGESKGARIHQLVLHMLRVPSIHPPCVHAELKAKEEAMKELAALADVQDGEVRAALEEGRAAHAAELQLQRQASRASEIGGLGGAWAAARV